MANLLIWARLEEELMGQKMTLGILKLDDLNYVVEDMIASPAYPDFVGTYWKATLTPKATPNNQQAEK